MINAPFDPMTEPTFTNNDLDFDADGHNDVNAPLAVDIESFNLAIHDATVTLTSPRTGAHRTIRIRTVRKGKLKGKRVLELLVGPSNVTDFLPFAFVSSATDQIGIPYVNVWKAYRGTMFGGGSVHDKLAQMVQRPDDWVAKGVTYHVALRCRRCGRLITTVSSITRGIGPICEGLE